MNATRDGNRKGSSCGGVLGQLSHEVMVQHGSYFKLVSNNCHYLTSVLSDQILLESQTSEVKECFTCATTRHNSKQFNVHHTSSPELSFSLVFYSLCYRISGSRIFLARTSISALFQNIIAHIYKKMKKIELCGVARAFVQISTNGPRSKKFGHPWIK